MTHRAFRAAFGGAAVSAALILAGCSSNNAAGTSTSGPSTPSSSSSQMSSSSAPSMTMSSVAASSGSAATPSFNPEPHNQADITFAEMMIPHHVGAISMAELAPERATTSEVKQLATEIKAAQGPEIAQMTGWLTAWGAPIPMTGSMAMSSAASSSGGMGGMGGMDHGGGSTTDSGSSSGMPGMMTPEQMAQLESAQGMAFDRLFLSMMIEHHQGAITMAQAELKDGSNPSAKTLAQSIITSQQAEIVKMQDLLKTM